DRQVHCPGANSPGYQGIEFLTQAAIRYAGNHRIQSGNTAFARKQARFFAMACEGNFDVV
ncbi:MAG TPA: hypothetical protein VMY39_09455, partial [Planctomycetota bacterium]|nr:hypothetical protein [Planctomycetota bacterium]